jgi:CO dehydrogenase/acetyl-CoA synthase gamma subunit (corrinoid Fe-S protein)
MLTAQEITAEGPVFTIKSSLETLQDNLKETKTMIDVESMSKMSYQYLLERMKKDFIAVRIKSGEMESSLKNKSQILDLEN